MKLLRGKWLGRIRRLLMVRGTHKWNAWVRDVTAMLCSLGMLLLTGCDLLDQVAPVPPIETFSDRELAEELLGRGFNELEDLFGGLFDED